MSEEWRKAHELMEKITKDCMAKEGPSSDDVALLIRLRLPKSLNGKCTLACTYETMGLVSLNISQNMKLTISFDSLWMEIIREKNTSAFAAIVLDHDQVKIEAFAGILDTCQAAIARVDERCEKAFTLAKCIDFEMHGDMDVV